MTNDTRLEIEMDIVRRYMSAMTNAGWAVHSVDYGDGSQPFEGHRLSDEERILFKRRDEYSFMYFVYGNEPGEVLSDYSADLEHTISPVNEYAMKWC